MSRLGRPFARGGDPATAPVPAAPARADRELLARRDRLTERLTAMQLDLGGAYYEMAIRDHIAHDVLLRKAAELQRVDAELRQVDALLAGAAAPCAACGTPYAQGAAYCSSCGTALAGAPLRSASA